MKSNILFALILGGSHLALGQVVVNSIDFETSDPVSSYPDFVQYVNGGLAEGGVYSISGGFLEQRTFTSTGAGYYSFFNNQLNDLQSLAIEVKLDVISVNGSFGIGFMAADGAYRYNLGITPTGIQLVENTGIVDYSAPISGSHTYRIESPASSGTANLFIDGVFFTSFEAAPYSAQNGFNFGDGAGLAFNGGDVNWDYITVSQNIALSAVPEPSTYAAIAFGVLGLTMAMKRRLGPNNKTTEL